MRSSLMGVLDALAIVPVLAQAPEGVHIRIRGTVDRLGGGPWSSELSLDRVRSP